MMITMKIIMKIIIIIITIIIIMILVIVVIVIVINVTVLWKRVRGCAHPVVQRRWWQVPGSNHFLA